jgi:lactose/L-arabinose transport system permease protein
MQRSRLVPYTFLVPYLAIFLLFWAWPILYSVYLSFLDTRGFPWAVEPAVNWGRILNDPFFLQALRNTLLILLVQVPLMLLLATGLAVGLNSPLLKLKGFYRFAFFAPVVVGAVAYSAVFRLLFNTQNGAVNAALTGLGLSRIDWLNTPLAAFVLIVLTVTWRWTGYNAIIILAGLQNIPGELYEAAKLDGANAWQQFWGITLPLLRPILLFAFVLSVIGTLQLFTEPFLITGGGPGNATLTLGVYLYQQGFRSFNFGYASAIGYAIALLAVLFSALQLRLFGQDPS